KQLHQPHDNGVCRSSVIPGEKTKHAADDQRRHSRQQTRDQRNSAAIEHARKLISPKIVGAEEKELRRGVHAKQVELCAPVAHDVIRSAAHEKAQETRARAVIAISFAAIRAAHQRIDKRPKMKLSSRIDEVHTARRSERQITVLFCVGIRRKKSRKNHCHVEHPEQEEAQNGAAAGVHDQTVRIRGSLKYKRISAITLPAISSTDERSTAAITT